MNGEPVKSDVRTEDTSAAPKNRGILARELTAACYEAWKGKNLYCEPYYVLDDHPEIRKAEDAIASRIGELERRVRDQAKVILQMQEAAQRMQFQVAEAIKVVGTPPKAEVFF